MTDIELRRLSDALERVNTAKDEPTRAFELTRLKRARQDVLSNAHSYGSDIIDVVKSHDVNPQMLTRHDTYCVTFEPDGEYSWQPRACFVIARRTVRAPKRSSVMATFVTIAVASVVAAILLWSHDVVSVLLMGVAAIAFLATLAASAQDNLYDAIISDMTCSNSVATVTLDDVRELSGVRQESVQTDVNWDQPMAIDWLLDAAELTRTQSAKNIDWDIRVDMRDRFKAFANPSLFEHNLDIGQDTYRLRHGLNRRTDQS